MNIGNIIKLLLYESGLNESELSRHTGIAKSTINNIINHNSNPTCQVLKQIAQFFGITISQLIGEDDLTKNRVRGLYYPESYTLTKIPLLQFNEIEPFLQDELKLGHNSKWISSEHELSNHSFALFIDNDMYNLFIPKNSIIIVNTSLQPNYGDIILIKTNNSITIKQLLLNNDKCFLKTLDSNFNTVFPINKKDIVFGTIVEQRYNFYQSNLKNAQIDNNIKLKLKLT